MTTIEHIRLLMQIALLRCRTFWKYAYENSALFSAKNLPVWISPPT
jgi:hypothetical protein